MPLVLAVVVAALVAALFAFAAYQLLRPIFEAVGRSLPGWAGAWTTWANNATIGVIAGAAGWIDAAIRPLPAMFRQFHGVLLAQWASVGNAINSINAAHHTTRYKVIPKVQADAAAYAGLLFRQLQQWTQNLFHGLQLYAQNLHAQALAYAQALQQQALSYSRTLNVQAQAYARTLSGQNQRYAQQLAAQGLNYTQSLAVAAEGYAQTLDRREQEYTQRVAGDLWQGVLRGLREQEDFTLRTGRVAEEYAQQAATGAAAYAQALAIPLAAAITAVEESACMRQCNTLGNLGAELSGLDLGFLFLLLGAAAADAPALAKAIDDDVWPQVEGMVGSLRGLIGV